MLKEKWDKNSHIIIIMIFIFACRYRESKMLSVYVNLFAAVSYVSFTIVLCSIYTLNMTVGRSPEWHLTPTTMSAT
jgi:hypothetical protein